MTTIAVSEWTNLNHSMMESDGQLVGCHAVVVEPILDGILVSWTCKNLSLTILLIVRTGATGYGIRNNYQ
jgi:hypothetical protein